MFIIQIPLLLIVGFFSIYLFILTVLAFSYKSRKINKSLWLNHFAIIVPAHDEEMVLSDTVKNLCEIDYPENLFDVIVVADNCSDGTSIEAAKAGALVLERSNMELKGKGYALKWSFDILIKNQRQYNAFLIIDADTTVSKNILKVLNGYLNSGCEAVQCSDLVQPKHGAWSSEITRISFLLYNYVRPLGKKAVGLSAGLRGNGMCFSINLLKKIPWSSFSQAEDLEQGFKFLLNGVPVTFAPEAKISAVMPVNSRNAESQRARWEIGRFPLIKEYSGKLLASFIKKKDLKLLDSLIDLLTPAFANLFALTLIMVICNSFLYFFDKDSFSLFMLLWVLIFVLQILHVLCGLYVSNADKDAYLALLNVPRYVLWKLWLYVKLIFKGHTRLWVRTTREQNGI